jgi:hypothetical protein
VLSGNNEESSVEALWNSNYSTCACLGWDGTKIYTGNLTYLRLGTWYLDLAVLKDRTWTETDTVRSWQSLRTYSITCTANCDL